MEGVTVRKQAIAFKVIAFARNRANAVLSYGTPLKERLPLCSHDCFQPALNLGREPSQNPDPALALTSSRDPYAHAPDDELRPQRGQQRKQRHHERDPTDNSGVVIGLWAVAIGCRYGRPRSRKACRDACVAAVWKIRECHENP